MASNEASAFHMGSNAAYRLPERAQPLLRRQKYLWASYSRPRLGPADPRRFH